MSQSVCFVIMGYGIKTDLATGRQLDLDKTYRNIIKPAVQEAGLMCVRADEIKHSGVIDEPMYQYLYNADVVVADLSTLNANAMYELGVRHALRPFTTIAISESKMQYPFDLSHTVIRNYEHLGSGIDHEEVLRFRQELKDIIHQIISNPETDSPVYTYLPDLAPPNLKTNNLTIENTISPKESLSTIIELALNRMDMKDFNQAIALLLAAKQIDPHNTFITQQLVLATYKSRDPDPVTCLQKALQLLQPLQPDITTDPETLGLAGAIYKRLFELQTNTEDLNQSIYYYEKGFYIKNDYYNGINLAYLLNLRGSLTSGEDAVADYVIANRVRRRVIIICEGLLAEKDFDHRNDSYWIVASLEEAYFGLEDPDNYNLVKEKATTLAKDKLWQRESTEEQIGKLNKLIQKKPKI